MNADVNDARPGCHTLALQSVAPAFAKRGTRSRGLFLIPLLLREGFESYCASCAHDVHIFRAFQRAGPCRPGCGEAALREGRTPRGQLMRGSSGRPLDCRDDEWTLRRDPFRAHECGHAPLMGRHVCLGHWKTAMNRQDRIMTALVNARASCARTGRTAVGRFDWVERPRDLSARSALTARQWGADVRRTKAGDVVNSCQDGVFVDFSRNGEGGRGTGGAPGGAQISPHRPIHCALKGARL